MDIDLNADVGESFGQWNLGDDPAVMEHLSSVNIACGFHASDPSVMRTTVELAAEKKLSIGAHPAYRDLAGFGRRFLDVAPNELADEVIYQIGALQAFASVAGTEVRYVKPHGALYNAIVHHEQQAAAVVKAIAEVDPELTLLTLPGSVVGDLARKAGLKVALEGFADRAYTPEGKLVPRTQPGAVLAEEDVADHVARMAEGTVKAIDGTLLPMQVDSICVHGDTPHAVATAGRVRRALIENGMTIRSFA